jgi:glc operon protein GlcG
MIPKLITKKSLSLEAAKTLVSFAVLKASELNVSGAIAVVDDGGHLIYLERLDGTMVAASNIAIGKASTAVGFKRPGVVLEQTVTTDRPAMKSLNGLTPATFVPLKGSYPIEIDREIVGAIAVAGAETGENDEIIAAYAVKCFIDVILIMENDLVN